MKEATITLNIGADDSNHAGTAKGEIIVFTFSPQMDDGVVRKFPNRDDISYVPKWARCEQGRDYRVALLTHEEFRESAHNLPIIAPFMIKNYLEGSIYSALPRDKIKIRLSLDGLLTARDKAILRDDFSSYGAFVVYNFLKKRKGKNGKVIKRHFCPEVVYAAHLLAGEFNGYRAEQLLAHPKFIAIPPADLVERMKRMAM